MIDQIEFVNFQGHRYTILDFSPGLNVITGRTHSGKSSLMRGIQWALENKPRGAGDKYKRDFTKPSDPISVSIAFSEGTYISREKTNKHNAYTSSEHPDPFLSLKTDVPDEIKEITKLKPHNFQSQKDKYFLISKTSGQVASELNKVVGLKIIDDKSAKIKRIVSDLTDRDKVLKSQIKATEERLKSDEFKIADSIKINLDMLDEYIDMYDSDSEALSTLIETVKEIDRHEKVIKEYIDMNEVEKLLPKIKSKINDLAVIEEKILAVQEISLMVESWGAELDQANKIVALEPLVLKIRKMLADIGSIESAIFEVGNIARDIALANREIKYSDEVIELNEDKLIKLEIELEKIIDYCTRCGAHKKYWRK